MANRLSGRRILISIPIVIFIIFILFIGPNSPQSPVRVPNNLGKAASSVLVKDDLTKGEVVMPKLGNETAKYVAALDQQEDIFVLITSNGMIGPNWAVRPGSTSTRC
jgi:hypothetical protein